MAKDIKRISAFRRKAKYIDRILTIFERTGFSVEYVYDDGKEPHSWGVHLAPNEDLIKEQIWVTISLWSISMVTHGLTTAHELLA